MRWHSDTVQNALHKHATQQWRHWVVIGCLCELAYAASHLHCGCIREYPCFIPPVPHLRAHRQALASMNERLQLLWDHVMPAGAGTKAATAGGAGSAKGSKRKASGPAKPARTRAGK